MTALIVHAGAWDIPAEEKEAHRVGVERAVRAGWDLLRAGSSAIEAVQMAVQVLEDDDALNAGRGSVLCRDGWVELDAALMDGEHLRLGAVACVRDVPNPVRLAGVLLDEETVFLSGEGASAFARERGMRLCDPASLVVERERRRLEAWRAAPGRTPRVGPGDTVGAVALDAQGHIAAASSTGGRPGKPSGRIGDAPLPGCGLWADDRVGGAVCTGWGEDVMRMGLARSAVELARMSDSQDACWLAMRAMEGRIRGRGGVALIGRDGGIGYAFNTRCMPVAWIDGDLTEPVVGGVS